MEMICWGKGVMQRKRKGGGRRRKRKRRKKRKRSIRGQTRLGVS